VARSFTLSPQATTSRLICSLASIGAGFSQVVEIWQGQSSLALGEDELVPLRAGETLAWRLQ